MLDRLSGWLGGKVVVATSTLPRDEPVVEIANAAGVAVARGPEQDVLARFVVALDEHPAMTVVRLTADCPLVDPQVLQATLDLHRERVADYTSNVLPRTFPKGLDIEVVSAAALRTADAESLDASEREHVTPFMYRRPRRFRLANLWCDEALGEERWTVDTAGDLEAVRRIVAAMGGRTSFTWQEAFERVGRAPSHRADLELRPARMDDAGLLLAWRNDPDTIRNSFSGVAVAPSDHRNWLTQRLRDPASRIYVATMDGAPMGMARLDVRDVGVAGVSVAVDPAMRGRRLGTALLSTLVGAMAEDQQVTTLVAHVKPENTASVRAFSAAGFSEVDRSDDRVQLQRPAVNERVVG